MVYRPGMPRVRLVPLLALLTGLGAAPPASGALQDTQTFTARIAGTYTTTGTLTNTKCHRVDDRGNEVPFTATGEASETAAFRATRGAVFAVSRYGGGRLSAGGLGMPVTARLTRSSTMDSDADPRGCRPAGSFTRRPDCGTRTRGYRLMAYGGRRGNVFSYHFVRRSSTTFPPDPFFECPLVAGQTWWGNYYSRGNGSAPMPAGRLFNRRVRTVRVTGGLTRSVQSSSAAEGYSARSTVRLRWTLTLTRRR